MDHHQSLSSVLASQDVYDPLICARPENARSAARWFLDNFQGDVLYAVKANPAPWLIDALYAEGLRWFDVASEGELELVASRCPEAVFAYMHPIKSRRAIYRAYHEFGCRIFSLDSAEELQKIVEETGEAKDLTLVVRLATTGEGSVLPLAKKFGVSEEAFPALLQQTRAYADELGVSFHVGSQCMDPQAYRTAMHRASDLIRKACVTVDIVDVGGGFPSPYPGMTPPPLSAYIDAIDEAFEEMMVLENADLWCEPGRALCAESASLVTRVDLVRGNDVFLNDGGYGALYDAVHERWRFPMRVFSADGVQKGHLGFEAFKVYGPTCDSADAIEALVHLPVDLCEGDYVEFGNIGAYGQSMATRFNGFGGYKTVEMYDAPFESAYATSGDVIPFRRIATGSSSS